MTRLFILPLLMTVCACMPDDEAPVLDGLPPAWTQTDAVSFNDNGPIPPEWLTTDTPLNIVPKRGTIGVRSEQGEAFWQTVDLSAGAIDTSARFETVAGIPSLSMIAFAPEDQFLDGIRQLRINATFDAVGTGTSVGAVLSIADSSGELINLASTDDFAIVLQRVISNSETGYGQIKGTLRGTLCDTGRADPQCRLVVGNFDTDAWVQN